MNKMNQTQTRSPRKRLLSLILAVILMIGLLPISAFATSASAQAGEDKAATQDSEFLRIFHLDCGRKYFTVGQIKDLIDTASANNYTHVELAVGNNGLRFLLKDMSLEVDGKTYTSDDVTTAIEAGNKQYSNSKNTTDSALSETDMDTIIAYARGKNIRIIPLINTPGHMNAILSAAKSLTRTTCAYNRSGTTIDVTNTTAVAFTQALLKKYVSYFAGKGCEYFNMGADEYANDIYTSGSMGFGQLQSSGQYRDYVTYVNQVAKLIDDAGMTPMAFNDGIYYKSNEFGGTFDSNIVVCYWTSGFNNGDGGRYDPAPASFLVSKGHKVINTQDAWYYVLGRSNGTYGLSSAKKGANNTSVTSVPGGGATPIGCMQCLWCDEPSASYSNTEVSNVKGLMQTLSSNNPTYFAEVAPLGPSIKPESGTSLTVGSNGTVLTISGVTDGSTVTWTVDNLSVIKLLAAGNDDGDSITGTRVTAVPVGEGTATVTATVDGKAYTVQLTVTDPNTEHVYVSVGETSKIFTQSGDVTGNVVETDYNRSVASYTAEYVHTDASQKKTLGSKVTMNSDGTYTGVISDGTNYLVIDSSGKISSTTKIADATEFTVVRNTTYYSGSRTYYTIQGNGHYLTVNQTGNRWGGYTYTLETTFQSEEWSYSASNGFSNNSRYLTYSNGWTVASSRGTDFLYSVKDESTQAKDETQITFTGVSVGETSVTIGGTKYVIHVQDKAPDDAMTTGTITLEYWITNFPVYESNNTSSSKSATISKTDSRVLTDDGLAVAELAPERAYSNFDGWKDVYYWQTMRLDKDNQQTMADKDDETSDGTTLTHIRYRNDAWQYKTAGGLWRYFLSTDQLVAYYLQKTEVTKEVTTYVKDWGYKTDSVTPNKDTDESNNYKGQVALTVAVVYPDGTVSPAEGDMYASSTTIFNYWSGRDIGIVAPVNNSDYNISKITVTDGTRSSTASHDTYDTWLSTDTITWDKKAQADGETQWYNETEVWNKSFGTTPMVNGKASNITWSAKNTAKLVLIYLEPIERETNLNVVYWDDNAKSQIYQYQIAMKYTQGGAVPSFITDLKSNGNVIGGTLSWPGKTSDVEGYLPDDAYVTNSSDVNQNISKALGTGMAGISGVYTSGLYEYVSADISTDGKTLTLHYNLKETEAKTFVVDFGLPLKIPASAFGITDTNTIETVSFEYNKVVHEKDGQYGHGSIDQKNGFVTYTLTKTLDSKVAIPLWVTFKNDAKPAQMLSVNIIPASNVYYEDSLASFTNGSGVAENAKWSTVGNNDQTTTEDGGSDVYQALQRLGDKAIYGNDDAYDNSSMLSMGTAHKVTVTAAMLEAYNGDNKDNFAWPTAQFTFKGTGFDIISLTDNTSGAIMVTVEGVTDTTYKKNFLVNNYYGYKYDERSGEWGTVASSDSNAIYQIPVMKVNGIPYGEYKVTIGVLYNSLFDKTGNSAYSFWLDAVRIYDPMGEYTGYTQDNEGYPQYIKLHDEVVKKTATPNGNALFIDGAEKATIEQYTNLGPNNEVYLMKGQAITFKLTGTDVGKIASVQIGAKAPKGAVELKVNDSVVVEKLSTATEMYYDITTLVTGGSYQVTITNTTGNILSLTNLKITYSEKGSVSLGTLNTQEQENAVSLVRALFTAPVDTFSPETFQADWGRAVRAGKRATLTVKTSADVKSITVDGQAITSYTTRTQRTGWGWWSPKVTYHVFTYTITAPAQTTDYAVCAVNAEGTASEAVTATLTVKPTTWWNWWF